MTEPQGSEQALDVLRGIWGAQSQTRAELEEFEPTGRICKNTAMLGIKGMDDEGMAAAMRAEWKRQLEREGKLRPGAQSVRDLVAGISEPTP